MTSETSTHPCRGPDFIGMHHAMARAALKRGTGDGQKAAFTHAEVPRGVGRTNWWEEPGQIARQYGARTNRVALRRKTFQDRASQLFAEERAAQQRERYDPNGASSNLQMWSFSRRFKRENRSLLLDPRMLEELQSVVAESMEYYNRRRHSPSAIRHRSNT